MSRSRAIETRLEKLTPSLDEYFSSGFLSRKEVTEVSRQRTHWEYRLVAKPLLLLDVQQAIKYELQLEDKLQRYCAVSKLTLRHRWVVLERVENLYRIGLKNLRKANEREFLRKECVQFLKRFHRVAALSKLYGEWMVLHPTRSDIWTEAAEWSAIDQNNIDNGRALIQQALLTMAGDASVWACAAKVELHMCVRLLRGLVESHRAAVKREREASQTDNSAPLEYRYAQIGPELRNENGSMGSILLDLALVETIIEGALESPASGPLLVQRLVNTAAAFPISASLIRTLRRRAVEHCLRCVHDQTVPQKVRAAWEDGAGQLIWDLMSVEHFVVNSGSFPLIDPSGFLSCGANVPIPTSETRVHAAGLALASTCAVVMKLCRRGPATLSSIHGLRPALSSGVVSVMKFLERCGVATDLLSDIATRFLSSDPKRHLSVDYLKKKLLCKAEPYAAPEPFNDAVSVAECVVAELEAVPRLTKKSRGEEEKDSVLFSTFWPVHCFVSFIRAEDADAAVAPALFSSETLSAETVDRLIVWWKSLERLEHGRRATPEEMQQLKDERLRMVVKLFKQYDLFPFSQGSRDLSSNNESSSRLLSRQSLVAYVAGKTPVTLWKVFNAMEIMCGSLAVPESLAASDDSSSDDDDKEERDRRRSGPSSVSCYATAGIEFLASIGYGTLNAVEEWDVVEGVCALVRSRLFSLSGKTAFNREDIQAIIRSRGTTWVEQVKGFLKETQRYRPRPRFALVSMVLPLLEAVALEAPSAAAMNEARAAYEELLSLYTLTQHPDQFPPLLFDGSRGEWEPNQKAPVCSKNLPREWNAADWMRYVHFERFVASDLTRAQKVMERARRFCLAPQTLLLANHSAASVPSGGRQSKGIVQELYESI